MPMKLEEVNIYRMTHVENLLHIFKYGITHRNSINANLNFISIGDRSLIITRSHKIVNITNGNFKVMNSITLGDFIPFYFGIRMPMLYVIQNGGNFVEQATPASEIIYIACSVKKIVDLGKSFYFSDGHATDNFTTFYDKSKVLDLPNLLNWDAIKTSYWGGHENLNLKRQKQAEFLIASDVPYEVIIGFGCYNDLTKNRLIGLGIEESMIRVIPNAYY